MDFQLVPKSVTLNGVMAIILHILPNWVAFLANYVKVIN